MRLRSLVAMAATSVLSLQALAEWPSHDANQDGVINFVDLNAVLDTADFAALNQVLADWGRLVAPEVVGDPESPGADAKAIARWNAIPGQFASGAFQVGIVAYHMNEIAEVRFFLNSAPLDTVTVRSTNPSTGNPEFWITIPTDGFADGSTITLSALVLPTGGQPRILQGEFNAATSWKGEYSLPLVVRKSAPPTVYVGYDGSDANPGTREQPFLTIGRAVRMVSDGGDVVLLNTGGYAMPDGGDVRANTRWITVRPDTGISRDLIGITADQPGLLRPPAERIRWKDLSFDCSRVTQFYNLNQSMVWLDGCRMYDPRGWDAEGYINPPVRNPWFATDCIAENKFYAFPSAVLVRNSTARRISGDVFQMSKFVIGCTAETVDGRVLPHHTDVFQWWGPQENVLAVDVISRDLTSPQNLFMRPSWVQNDNGSQSYWMRNTAFVNLRFEMHPVFQWSNNANAYVNAGGPPWSQLQGKFDHVLFERIELANQRLILRTGPEVPVFERFEAKNLVFREMGMHPLTFTDYHNPAAVPAGVQFIDCYPHPEADSAP
jgi:hypothetical protein